MQAQDCIGYVFLLVRWKICKIKNILAASPNKQWVQIITFLIKSIPFSLFPNLADDTGTQQPLKMKDALLLHIHPLTKESILQAEVNAFVLWTDLPAAHSDSLIIPCSWDSV